MVDKTHKLEKLTVQLLNLDGWKLEWTGDRHDSWDAEGWTPKKNECVIEMKFRNKYYDTKLLEQLKYDKLMATGKVAIYFVNDPKANYMYWLNNLKLNETVDMYCPDTTLWTKKKLLKPCYLLTEKQATIINPNDIDLTNKGVWSEYFKNSEKK